MSTGLNTLLGGGKATDDEVAKLGLTLYNAQGQFVGMASVIGHLQPKLAKMTEEQRLFAEKELFGAGASKALDDTIMAGLPAFDQAAAAANKVGTAQIGAKTATDNLHGSIEKIKAGFDDAAIKLGQSLLPMFQQLATWIEGHQKDIANVATTIGTDLANGAHAAGQFIANDLWPPLKDVGGFISANLDTFKTFGEFIAGWYVVGKGVSIFNALKGDLEGLLGTLNKLGGFGGARSIGSEALPMHVWVDNPGFGASGTAGAVPAAEGAGAAGVAVPGVLGAAGAGLAVFARDKSSALESDPARQLGGINNILETLKGNVWRNGQLISGDLNYLETQLQLTGAHGSDMAVLAGEIADLYKTHVVTTAPEMQAIIDEWNKGHTSAADVANLAEDMASVAKVSGPLTGQAMQEFLALWNSGVTNVTSITEMMSILTDYSKKYGPLSGTDLQTFESLVSAGMTDADQIHSFLKGAIPHASDTSHNLQTLAGLLGNNVQAAQDLLNAIHSDTGNIGNLIGGAKPPGSWSGGFIPPGAFGVVNEVGPELLYGGPYGTTVFPRGGEPAAGGQTINVYVTAPQASPDDIANEIAWAIK